MKNEMGISFTEQTSAGVRALPEKEAHNELCPEHRPKLPPKPLIGSQVVIEADGVLRRAEVTGPASVYGSQPRSARGRKWQVVADNGTTAEDVPGR